MSNISPNTSLAEMKTRYDEDGYVSPIRIMSDAEMAGIRSRAGAYLAQSKKNPKDDTYLQYKVHMAFEWADALIRNKAVLDAVEALIGPDILVWNTALLTKKPHTPDFVSWHQDVFHWGNHPDHVVGAWIAVADSLPDNGCVKVVPGSHKIGVLPHSDTFGDNNMLSRGQQITGGFDEHLARDMALQPGEMSLHHTRAVHCSQPNLSDRPRMGFVITYMVPATVMKGPRTGATLVRGQDRVGNFDLESVRPRFDLDPQAIAGHDQAMRAMAEAFYEGAEKQGRISPERIAM